MKRMRMWAALVLACALLCSAVPVSAAYQPSALKRDHSPIMNGYDNGKFGPGDTLTWAQVCTLVYNALEDQSMGTVPGSFSDVTADKWYYTAVMTLVSRGILPANGGKLGAQKKVTRREFVGLIVGLVGVDGSAECDFKDVSPKDRDYRAIATAVEQGWIQGTGNGKFTPDRTLNRAEAVTIFNRMMGRSADAQVLAGEPDLCPFTDVPKTAWYYSAVVEATIDHDAQVDENGAEHWTRYTRLWPVTWQTQDRTVTELVKEGETPQKMPAGAVHWLTPDGRVADPAQTPVTGAVTYVALGKLALKTDHSNYINGIQEGIFDPQGAVTRAQAAQILCNLLAGKDRGSFPAEFTDVPAKGKWYSGAVTRAASLGLVAGGGEFRPEEPMTRGELAELLTRLVPYEMGDRVFADVPADHPQYKAIMTAAAKGWIEVGPEGTFGPEETVTRAETVVIIDRMLGRAADETTLAQMDSRYIFRDVPRDDPAFSAIMEAAVPHTCKTVSGGERWQTYWHGTSRSVNWEKSDSVVNAASITNKITSTYSGKYNHDYNWDYSTGLKEWYVNSSHYGSETDCLVWVSLQNQKVYVFRGDMDNWKLEKTFICASGRATAPTRVGVTKITRREEIWRFPNYICAPVVRFYPGSGYAFHSRPCDDEKRKKVHDKRIGFPVSSGCIRMLNEDIDYIYKTVPDGSTVVVY